MFCSTEQMPRKTRTYKLDERVIDIVKELAKRDNMSANRYLENLLFIHGKQRGALPMNAEPLGETRGGDFSANRNYKKSTDEKTGDHIAPNDPEDTAGAN